MHTNHAHELKLHTLKLTTAKFGYRKFLVDKAGKSQRWFPIPGKGRVAIIVNGGIPYIVLFKDNNVIVKFETDYTEVEKNGIREYVQFDKVVFQEKVQKIWLGGSRVLDGPKERQNKNNIGHVVLLQRKNGKYVFIHESVAEFSTPEPILSLDSYMGPNMSPYSWAKTQNYYIFFSNGKPKQFEYIHKDLVKDPKEPYDSGLWQANKSEIKFIKYKTRHESEY